MGEEEKQIAASGTGPSSPPVDTERMTPLDQRAPSTAAQAEPSPRARRDGTQIMGSIDPKTLAARQDASLDPNSEVSLAKTASTEQSDVSVKFSEVVGRAKTPENESSLEPEERPKGRPAPARELTASKVPLYQAKTNLPAPEEGSHTTLQSMIRPDLMAHGVADPRRFLSIERELSETSAAIKFLEKRLNRAEKDSRIALAVAGLAVLLAVLAYLL